MAFPEPPLAEISPGEQVCKAWVGGGQNGCVKCEI